MSNLLSFRAKKEFFGILLAIVFGSQVLAFSEGQIGINTNFTLNIKVKFENVGGFSGKELPPGPEAGGGVDRIYDDGFNRVGSNGNALGQTFFWGYQNSSQVQGDTLILSSTQSSSKFESKDADDSTQIGVEVFFKLPVGNYESLNGFYNWGIRESISFFPLEFEDNKPQQGAVSRISDTFVLNGVIPPNPPFSGSFTGPGPLISDEPTARDTVEGDSVITGDHEIDADLFSFSIGPYLDFSSYHDRLNLSLEGGFLFSWIFSELSFTETDIFTPSGTLNKNEGSDHSSHFLFGGFVGTTVSCRLSSHMAIQGGVRYQIIEDFNHTEDGRKAELDFTGKATLSIGLSYLF